MAKTIMKHEEIVTLAGFWRDGAYAVPNDNHDDPNHWVFAMSKETTSFIMLSTVNEKIDWSKYIWLDTNNEDLTLPKLLALCNHLYPDADYVPVSNDTIGLLNNKQRTLRELALEREVFLTPIGANLVSKVHPLIWSIHNLQEGDYCRVRNAVEDEWEYGWFYAGCKASDKVVYKDDELRAVKFCEKVCNTKKVK